MSVAELRGKISSTGTNVSERMEDLLTSDVLGTFRYLPTHLGLLDFLGTSHTRHGKYFVPAVDPVRVNWSFWPYLKSRGITPCEPDVVLGLENSDGHLHIVMVEAKYMSGKSSHEDGSDRPHDQLARELANLRVLRPQSLGWPPDSTVIARTMLYVTESVTIPIREITESLQEYRRKLKDSAEIFWTSWRCLPEVLERAIDETGNENQAAMLSDLLELLLRKHLAMFQGTKPASFVCRAEDFEFYSTAPSKYDWPVSWSKLPDVGFYQTADSQDKEPEPSHVRLEGTRAQEASYG